jgi:hypothetical protein
MVKHVFKRLNRTTHTSGSTDLKDKEHQQMVCFFKTGMQLVIHFSLSMLAAL